MGALSPKNSPIMYNRNGLLISFLDLWRNNKCLCSRYICSLWIIHAAITKKKYPTKLKQNVFVKIWWTFGDFQTHVIVMVKTPETTNVGATPTKNQATTQKKLWYKSLLHRLVSNWKQIHWQHVIYFPTHPAAGSYLNNKAIFIRTSSCGQWGGDRASSGRSWLFKLHMETVM